MSTRPPSTSTASFGNPPSSLTTTRYRGESCDDPAVIDQTVCSLVDWFARHPGAGAVEEATQ